MAPTRPSCASIGWSTSDLKSSRSHSRIAVKAIQSTIIPVLITLVLAVLTTTYISHTVSVRQLEDKVLRIGTEHRLHLEELLWQFDIEGVEAELQNFIDMESIQHVAVTDLTGQVMERGQPMLEGDPVAGVFALTHDDGLGNSVELGSLTVEANKQALWETAIRRALVLIAMVALSTVFMAVLVVRQINKSVLAPLVRISSRLRSTPQVGTELTLDLGRGPVVGDKDELDDLVDSIHQMRDQILLVRESMEESEKRLAQAAQLAGLAYCTMDSKFGRIIECDEKYAAMHRKTVDEMLSLNLWTDIVEPLLEVSALPRAVELRKRIMDGNNEIQTFQILFDDGEFVYVRQYFVCRYNDQSELVAIQVIAQDVTDDMLTQKMLLQSQKTEAIGKLTGGVAHDFNNILAIIAGNLEMSINDPDSANVAACNLMALEAVDRGANLTGQLLSFARKQPLSPVVIDAAKRVRDSATLLRASVGEAVNLEIVSDAGIWKTRADPVQLDAVVLNLVVNARDAMPQGGALTIEVSNARLDAVYARAHLEVTAGNYVCIAVTDTGHGMSAATTERAIEPFFTTKAEGDGTGLGLSMAYGFAKQSGGHLKIYSEEGKGTTVKLYLPRMLADVAEKDPVVPQDHKVRLAGLHVLLIEDNEQLRWVFTSQIESLGCIVHTAFDETSALALAREVTHVDIILSDIVLPGDADGRQVAEQLSRIYPNVKIVYMSGFTANSIIHKGQLDEGIAFLQKPFRLKDLAQCLTETVAIR